MIKTRMRPPFLRIIKKDKGFRSKIYDMLLSSMLRLFNFKREIEYFIKRQTDGKVIEKINGLRMLLLLKDKGIHRELFLYKKREKLATDYLLNGDIIKEGDVALDIGANVGYYALIESRLVGKTGRVYAIEPISTNLNVLKKNIELNNIKNIQVFPIAIGDKNGKEKMYITEEANLCSMKKSPGRVILREEEVEVMTLDSFLEGKIEPNLIRMDVEGYECNIINGMKKTLEKDVKLLVEVHGHLMTRDQSEDMLKLLKEKGFDVKFSIIEPKYSLNTVTTYLLRKLNPMIATVSDVNIDKLKEMIAESKLCAHVLFSK